MRNPPRRVLVAGLFHETNTFLTEITGREAFEERTGAALLAAAGDASPLGGALAVAEERGWNVIPAIDLRATPSGTVAAAVVARFWEAFAATAAAEGLFDGVLLILHGAMVSESLPDVEGEMLTRIRGLAACAGIPVCGVLDLHANVSEAMARGADALLAYRENPHTDGHETGRRAALLLDQLMATGTRRRTLRAQPPIVWPPTGTATAADPMRTLEAMARAAEAGEPGIEAVNIFAGFSFADVAEAGVSFTVVCSPDDAGAVKRARAVLASLLAATRRWHAEGIVLGMPLTQALGRLREPRGCSGPVLLVEPSDNIGAGAPGDSTHILRVLVENGIPNAGVILNDPEAVAALADARPGERRTLPLGGRSGGVGALPLTLEVEFVRRTDGRFHLEDPQSHLASMSGGVVEMGPCAVVRHGTLTLLLTSRKTPPFDLGQWRSQGIVPEALSVIGVKAAVAHRRAYDSIMDTSFTVETPGPCASDLRTLPFRRIRRPVYPLDELPPDLGEIVA